MLTARSSAGSAVPATASTATDATRIAYIDVLADEKAQTAVGFLRRAVSHNRRYGIQPERVMTDNGPACLSVVHAIAVARSDRRPLTSPR